LEALNTHNTGNYSHLMVMQINTLKMLACLIQLLQLRNIWNSSKKLICCHGSVEIVFEYTITNTSSSCFTTRDFLLFIFYSTMHVICPWRKKTKTTCLTVLYPGQPGWLHDICTAWKNTFQNVDCKATINEKQLTKVIWHKAGRFNRICELMPIRPRDTAQWRHLANTTELVFPLAYPSP